MRGPPPDPVPFTTDAGREFNPTFSPDGNSVAYSWNGDRRDNFDIFLPAWLARYNKVIFGSLYLAGIAITVARWRGWLP